MSWQGYVNNLEASAHCTYAAICGHDGTVWAQSETKPSAFQISPSAAEFKVGALAVVTKEGDHMQKGITFGGNKFTCTLSDDDVLCCQGKEDGKKDYSLVFIKSTQCVLVGFNPQVEIKTAMVRFGVEKTKDYLKNVGY